LQVTTIKIAENDTCPRAEYNFYARFTKQLARQSKNRYFYQGNHYILWLPFCFGGDYG
jgi:hypothetical protein